MMQKFTAQNLDSPTRLDKVLREQYPQWGRRAVQSAISSNNVSVNGRKVWLSSWKVRNGDRLEIRNPPPDKPPPVARFDDAWLIVEDGPLIVVNKPAGLLAEPTRDKSASSLLTLASARFGPVTLRHRLDRDTSGLILMTRQEEASKALNRYLDAAFKEKTIKKRYVAIISAPISGKHVALAPSGEIRTRLDSHPRRRDRMVVVPRGGKYALTRYEIEARRHEIQRIVLWPETGRMHQLRVHMQHVGAPILGDRLYGKREVDRQYGIERLMLHAEKITLPAAEGFESREFVAEAPESFVLPL